MATINIKEEFWNLQESEELTCASKWLDIQTTYVWDNIMEVADSVVDIYYSDLENWLTNNSEAVEFMEEVAKNGMLDIKNYAFFSHVQMAQCEQNSQHIYDNLQEYLKLSVYDRLLDAGIEKIESEQLDEILEDIEKIDRFDEINDKISEVLENDR